MKLADRPDRDLAAILGVAEESLAPSAPQPSAQASGGKLQRWPRLVIATVLVGGLGAVLVRERLHGPDAPSPSIRTTDATAEGRRRRALADMMINAPAPASGETVQSEPRSATALRPSGGGDERLAAQLNGMDPQTALRRAAGREATASRSSRARGPSTRLARAERDGSKAHVLRSALQEDSAKLEARSTKPIESDQEKAARLERLDALDAIRLLRQK